MEDKEPTVSEYQIDIIRNILRVLLPSTSNQTLIMFLRSILVKLLEQLVAYSEDEDAANCTGTRDRFSELPDALLLNILDRLGTFDAVRACVLSNHLLRLPAMLSRIVINVRDVSPEYSEPADLDFINMARANRVVAKLTDKVLTTRPPQITIRKLKLTFMLSRDHHCFSIGRSVAHAMATRNPPETVQFRILTKKDLHSTPADLVRYGKRFNAFFAACHTAFAGLTRLDLQNLTFAGESDLHSILRTCKRLEYLHLEECNAGIDSVLRIEHDRLVELRLEFGEFQTLELCRLPKLQRLTCHYWDHDGNLVFGFVPRLSKLWLMNSVVSKKTIRLSQLLANASTICNLRLDFESEKIWVRPESPRLLTPVLNKLRTVNLDNLPERCDITWTMFILEAAPFLQQLCITVWDHWCQTMPHQAASKKKYVKWKPFDDDFKHANLAKLTIFGFQPDANFMGYVVRVMNAAVRIKDVSLHDRKVCERCVKNGIEVCPSTYPRTDEEKDSCTEKIIEGLVVGSPAVIHFRS